MTLREVPFGDALVKGIWAIYNGTPLRQGRRFPHYGKDIETVHREEATHLDRSVFMGAYYGDQLVGFVKLVADDTRTQTGLINIVSLIRHRDKAPPTPCWHERYRLALPRHPVSCLLEVRLREEAARHPQRLSERNGFSRVDVPRYHVPLTRLGWLALRSGLHHRLAEHIPASLAAKLRDIRAAWHSRTARPAVEASCE